MWSFLGAIFGVLIAGLLSQKYLSKKDKIEWLEKSYPQGEKLYELLSSLESNIDLATFKNFELYLQHLCIMILSDAIPLEVFKYKYYPFLKGIVDVKFIEDVHNVLNIPFKKEDYNYLDDACNWKPENISDLFARIKKYFNFKI